LGRIYRVYPESAKLRAIPRMDKMDTAGLVAALDSPNGWQRDMAHMMLLWRNDKEAVPLLMKLFAECKNPKARLQALCVLDGLGGDTIPDTMLISALATDLNPGVRRHVVRLAYAHAGSNKALQIHLLAQLVFSDPLVRMELVYVLGSENVENAGLALGQLALKDGNDRFMLAAILSSVNEKNIKSLLVTVLKEGKGSPPAGLLEGLLRTAIGMKQPGAIAAILQEVGKAETGKFAPWQLTALAGRLTKR
jgi:hypothetical protein